MDCINGKVTILECPPQDDCNCVGVKSITWNAAGTQFTVTLTNGQAITSPVLTGSPGAAPTILFRVSGTTLQYNVDGGAWNSLINLSTLIDGKNIITNNPANSGTTATGWQTLNQTNTEFANPSKNLSVNGDALKIYTRFTSYGGGSNTRLRMNGSVLLSALNHGFYSPQINAIEYEICVSRISNISISAITKVYNYQDIGLNVFAVVDSNSYHKQIITVPDLGANNLTFSAEANAVSATVDTVVCEYFRNEIYKKI